MWRGLLAPSRVIDLTEQSPDDSALATAIRGGLQHRAWDLQTHLLAAAVEAQHHTAWVTAQANSKKKIAKPKPLPRPGVTRNSTAKRLDLSNHPAARPLPAKYLMHGAHTGSG